MGRKMTEEQKKEAGERLAEARALKNPPQYKNIHPSILELDDTHKLSMKSVKGWIKNQRELLKTERYNHRKGSDKKALANMNNIQGYIRQLQYYLENGDYVAMRYGADGEHPVMQVCTAMAYDSEGFVKRNIGVLYPDIGEVWTKEMDDEKRGKF